MSEDSLSLFLTVLVRPLQVDILVHNSGISQAGLVHRTSLEVVQKIFEVNTLGVISLTNAVLPHMMNRRAGHFVFTGSISQLTGEVQELLPCHQLS